MTVNRSNRGVAEPLPAGTADAGRLSVREPAIAYLGRRGLDEFLTEVHGADPMRLIELERHGVAGAFVKDLARRLGLPSLRLFEILGVPKATAERRIAAGERLTGSGGRAALGMARLLAIAQELVAESTADEAAGFDAAKWLGRWLERPQPALGGRRAADLVDTPTGFQVVARLLGSIESGAYQ